MITVFLVIFLNDFPFLMFGQLAKFDTMKECRAHIEKDAPPELRPKMRCIQVVGPDVKEA